MLPHFAWIRFLETFIDNQFIECVGYLAITQKIWERNILKGRNDYFCLLSKVSVSGHFFWSCGELEYDGREHMLFLLCSSHCSPKQREHGLPPLTFSSISPKTSFSGTKFCLLTPPLTGDNDFSIWSLKYILSKVWPCICRVSCLGCPFLFHMFMFAICVNSSLLCFDSQYYKTSGLFIMIKVDLVIRVFVIFICCWTHCFRFCREELSNSVKNSIKMNI